MKVLISFWFAAVSCLGQLAVTAAPTPAAVAKAFLDRKIAGVGVWAVTACAPVPFHAGAGEIVRQAFEKQGIVLFPSAAVDAVTNVAIVRSRASIAMDVGEGISLGGAALTSSKIINADERMTAGMVFAAGAAHWAASKFQRTSPDPSRLKSLTLPDSIDVPVAGCWTGLALGRLDRVSPQINIQAPPKSVD